MESGFEKAERARAAHGEALMAIDGVASVMVGFGRGGEPRLRVGTSVPVDEVRKQVLEELKGVAHMLEYEGDLGAKAGRPEGPEPRDIGQVRAKYESALLQIAGVVSVAAGFREDGTPCLMIGTSIPVDEVRRSLPEELASVEVDLQFVGEIRPQ
ncbi:MAG: hypothetical protein IH945_11295 [Armatimonadetes bacterium]|nr:hypothetical protein [Armatimonadota bacterium]